ncbi:MAG: hypothetical protein E7293_05605 [Lachnospiraceae bacterium]|nr:hypothetical protein [Lachnospiraceae bacterium]
MKHSIVFEHCGNKWDNALPLGNGVFGAMLYYEKDVLYMPMNHYEVYYNISKNVLPEHKLAAHKPVQEPGRVHQDYVEKAIGNEPAEGEPFCYYRTKKADFFKNPPYSTMGFSGSYPATGDLEFYFADSMKDADSKLTLFVEDAKTKVCVKKDDRQLKLDTIIARKDCVINRVRQSEPGLLKSVKISLPPYRDLDYPQITYRQEDEATFVYTVSRDLGREKPFTFSGVVRLVGAKGRLEVCEFGADILLEEAKEEFHVLCGIFTDWCYQDTEKEGVAKMQVFQDNLEELYQEHREYWKEFFGRSSISIPDRFLEHVYYVNQYALDCCSGKDGIMKHHACGLNGLWDVKHPTLWGSMWYWDVNIQAAFAGVFSSNRLDLAKVFSDGLRTYTGLAEAYAKDIHNLDGYAMDYPYDVYYCVWPWCAQYLWFLYEYSLDTEYLRNEAFPLFLKLCEFAVGLFQYDEKRGYYTVYPDISPEQGPLAHDTTITVASVKYLLKFTLKAAEILGENPPILKKCKELVNNMAPYFLSKDGTYGVHLKDSEEAPDNLWIRHPSMLMPVFPVGEYDMSSDERMQKIFLNTIDYLEDRCEIGIFQSSWLAAAAARLGKGQTALRLLYERGIDHMLRSNGLSAEETDHFINYCLVMRQPLYYPCMMEFTGEMLAAVNEMLLQSQNDLIRVFPALPDGDKEYGRFLRHGYNILEYDMRTAKYAPWETVRFDTLLAKGAFEVSASLKAGKLEFILLHSRKGGTARVTSPFFREGLQVYCQGQPVEAQVADGVYTFETQAGKSYLIAESPEVCTAPVEEEAYQPDVLSRETYTKRRIYLGEDVEAQYQKALDGAMRAWYLGNLRFENHTVYKFDFTKIKDKKYADCLTCQVFGAEEMGMRSMAFVTIDEPQFTVKKGYGFADGSKAELVDREEPDLLRRDFAQGQEEAEFVIEVPRGQYELLVVSGDAKEDSVTIVEGVNGRTAGGEVIPAGQYQCKLIPIVQEEDAPVRLKLSTKPGYQWKVNFIVMNMIKGY